MRSYHVKKINTIKGMCPPGYEKVKAHEKGDTHVNEYCRKIKVQGRTKTLMSDLYNETRIAGSDAVLGFDTITDSTAQEEKHADNIKMRSDKIINLAREQEERKKEARTHEDNFEKVTNKGGK